MKHQNIVDKARSATQTKAAKSKALYAKNHAQVATSPVIPTPVHPQGGESPDSDAESTIIEKIGAGLKKNPRKLAVAGGVVATVAVATTLAIGEKVGKSKLGRKVVAAEKKALSRAKELVTAVKSSAVAKSVTKSMSKPARLTAGSTAKRAKKSSARSTGVSKAKSKPGSKSKTTGSKSRSKSKSRDV